MPYCPEYGKKVKEEGRFCPHCGATVAEAWRPTEAEAPIDIDVNRCGEPPLDTSS